MVSFHRSHAALIVLFAVVGSVSPVVSATEQDCQNATTTAATQNCAGELYRSADAELNRVYRQLSTILSDDHREQLKAAQRAWIVFRDRNATFAAGAVAGGSMYPLLELSEKTAMTERRTEQLRSYLQ